MVSRSQFHWIQHIIPTEQAEGHVYPLMTRGSYTDREGNNGGFFGGWAVMFATFLFLTMDILPSGQWYWQKIVLSEILHLRFFECTFRPLSTTMEVWSSSITLERSHREEEEYVPLILGTSLRSKVMVSLRQASLGQGHRGRQGLNLWPSDWHFRRPAHINMNSKVSKVNAEFRLPVSGLVAVCLWTLQAVFSSSCSRLTAGMLT